MIDIGCLFSESWQGISWIRINYQLVHSSTRPEQHHRRLQVSGNKWISIIVYVKRVRRIRMKDLREEVATKACKVSKVVQMKLAGHIWSDDSSPKRSETKKHEGSRKLGGRSQLR